MSTKDPYELPEKAKAEIAQAQVDNFRLDLYAHTLDLARLEALPDDAQDKEQALAATNASIETIKSAIDATIEASPAE